MAFLMGNTVFVFDCAEYNDKLYPTAKSVIGRLEGLRSVEPLNNCRCSQILIEPEC